MVSSLLVLILGLTLETADLGKPVKVVATLPTYASIAADVGGSRVQVGAISRADEDAHFVKPKPSFALQLRDADLFISTGLDLELWAPVLVDKSGNRRIRDGAPGYVNASQGVTLLEVPSAADRSQGDVHIYGNPHITTSPLNVKIVAGNIAAGLERVDPEGAATYRSNLEHFRRRVDEALYGPELVEILGADALDPLLSQGRLVAFLATQSLNGRPLSEKLGGWLGQALPLRDQKVVAYHSNWVYLARDFGLDVVDYVEAKPGIPPSARHVHDLVETIKNQEIRVLIAASYYSQQQVEAIVERTGCHGVRVPMGPNLEGGEDYFSYMNELVGALAVAAAD